MKQKKEQEKETRKYDTCKYYSIIRVDHFNGQVGKTEPSNKLLYKEVKTCERNDGNWYSRGKSEFSFKTTAVAHYGKKGDSVHVCTHLYMHIYVYIKIVYMPSLTKFFMRKRNVFLNNYMTDLRCFSYLLFCLENIFGFLPFFAYIS